MIEDARDQSGANFLGNVPSKLVKGTQEPLIHPLGDSTAGLRPLLQCLESLARPLQNPPILPPERVRVETIR